MDKSIDCQLVQIVEEHGFLQCADYAAEKCEALAKALRCETKDILQAVAEAQASLLILQMAMTPRFSLECLISSVEKVVANLAENNTDE